jgi:lipid A 4'-phosphatase
MNPAAQALGPGGPQPESRRTAIVPTQLPHRPRTGWSWREREWSAVAWTGAVLCLVFSLWPELDLVLAAPFSDGKGGFIGNTQALVLATYHVVPWLGRGLAVAALVVTLWPTHGLRGRPGVRWRRRWQALGLCLLIGVGLTVNGGLKTQWGRARPAEVVGLGGTAQFSPALRPVAQCRDNCSFVSGHAATGFALMAFGLLGTARQRRRWLVVGLCAGLWVGLGRMAQGGHFASDVLFAGLVIWICNAALREAWLQQVCRRRRRCRIPVMSPS